MDELYILARRVLLDALDALGSHRSSVILVGAQAVYLRVGEADVAVAPYTTDGDLVVNPSTLAEIPPLEKGLQSAGFVSDSVGIWTASKPTSKGATANVTVDLLVPRSLSPAQGRRAARLIGHDNRAARIVQGLEGTIVDSNPMTLSALETHDTRSVELQVAGPAALLIAKAHKIRDRQGSSRLEDKDALDVFRLLRGTSNDDLVARYQALLANSNARTEAETALALLLSQFGSLRSPGIAMLQRTTDLVLSPSETREITESCMALVSDLLRLIKQ